MLKHFLPLTCLILTNIVFAQPPEILWYNHYGGSHSHIGTSVLQTFDGGFITAGYAYSDAGPNWYDGYIVRTDANGDSLWTRRYAIDVGDTKFLDILQVEDGSFIACGHTAGQGAGGYDGWIISIDPLGNPMWSRTYGDPDFQTIRTIKATPDGGYILFGGTNSQGAGDIDYWLIKTDSEGYELWDRVYGGADREYCHDGDLTADGGYIITGRTETFAWEQAAWTVKTDAFGDTLWTHAYLTYYYSDAQSVEGTTDGGCVITGSADRPGELYDVFVLKLSSEGDSEWLFYEHLGWGSHAADVHQTTDNGYVATGHILSPITQSFDIYVVKIDATGDSTWTMIHLWPDSNESIYGSYQTNDDGYILTGDLNNDDTHGCNLLLLRLSPEGEIVQNFNQPDQFTLTAYPNPFNPSTTIELNSTIPGEATVSIYNIRGQIVDVIHDGFLQAGNHTLIWQPDNLSSGIYFVNLRSTDQNETLKITYIE